MLMWFPPCLLEEWISIFSYHLNLIYLKKISISQFFFFLFFMIHCIIDRSKSDVAMLIIIKKLLSLIMKPISSDENQGWQRNS